MDVQRDVPYGPHPLQKIGTVTVPKPLLLEVGLDVGDTVHWMLNPDIPGTLVLVPSRQIARAMAAIIAAIAEAGE